MGGVVRHPGAWGDSAAIEVDIGTHIFPLKVPTKYHPHPTSITISTTASPLKCHFCRTLSSLLESIQNTQDAHPKASIMGTP